MQATYYYLHPVETYPVATYIKLRMRVEILGETPKGYKIKYLGKSANNGRGPGYITSVRKRSIVLDGQPNAPDIEDVRLPYKD